MLIITKKTQAHEKSFPTQVGLLLGWAYLGDPAACHISKILRSVLISSTSSVASINFTLPKSSFDSLEKLANGMSRYALRKQALSNSINLRERALSNSDFVELLAQLELGGS